MRTRVKVIIVLLVLALSVQVINGLLDDNKDKDEYKLSVFNYIVSIEDIMDILISRRSSGENLSSICSSLVLRMDRLEKFIYHSDLYLDFGYQPRSLAFMTHEVEGIVNDFMIDDLEIQRLEEIDQELEHLIDRIGVYEDGDWNVNYELDVQNINTAIESFASKLQ